MLIFSLNAFQDLLNLFLPLFCSRFKQMLEYFHFNRLNPVSISIVDLLYSFTAAVSDAVFINTAELIITTNVSCFSHLFWHWYFLNFGLNNIIFLYRIDYSLICNNIIMMITKSMNALITTDIIESPVELQTANVTSWHDWWIKSVIDRDTNILDCKFENRLLIFVKDMAFHHMPCNEMDSGLIMLTGDALTQWMALDQIQCH